MSDDKAIVAYGFPRGDEEDVRTRKALRDYFAALATEKDIELHSLYCRGVYTREEARYKYADAMLKAREQ